VSIQIQFVSGNRSNDARHILQQDESTTRQGRQLTSTLQGIAALSKDNILFVLKVFLQSSKRFPKRIFPATGENLGSVSPENTDAIMLILM